MGHFKMGVIALCVAALFAACSSEISDQATAPSSKDNGHVSAVTDEYLVEYTGSIATAEKTITACGGVITNGLPVINIALVTGLDDAELKKLEASANIKTVVLNVRREMAPSLTEFLRLGVQKQQVATNTPHGNPQDASLFGLQWGMQRINAPQAWLVTKGAGVRVGILDTGGSPDHKDLIGKYDESACRNFTSADPNDWQDRHFHGTHVAGTIATNNVGVAGVSPDATLIAVKILGDDGWGDDYWVIAGILYAADPNGGNCDVINMSIGGTSPRAHFGKLYALYQKAIAYANAQGCVVVSAAGNDAADMDHDKNTAWFPAQAARSIGVSATGPVFGADFDQLSCYSNYGSSSIDLAAPGGNFDCTNGLNAVQDLVISCFAPYVAAEWGLPNPATWYIWAAGTSMATPHVSGGAALVLAAKGGTPGYVEGRLQNTAQDLGKPGKDPQYGHGLLDVGAAVR